MPSKPSTQLFGSLSSNSAIFMRDFEREFTGARSLDLSRELNPGVQTFADWLARHKAQIPLS